MTNPAVIEVMLLRWSDNQNGRTVTFLLADDGGEHPFRGLKCGPENGDRLAVSIARIADDETQHPVTVPTKPKSYAQESGKMCADPEFQKFIGAANGSIAADIVREYCRVQSRKEILEGTPAAAKWSDLMARFEIARRE